MRRLVITVVLFLAFAVPAPAQEGTEPDLYVKIKILFIQDLLNAFGYDAGPTDGILGPKTIEAIRAFETEQGLPHESLDNNALTNLLAQMGHVIPDSVEGVTAQKRALDLITALEALGSAAIQYNFGLAYAKGEGVPQDYAEAFKWFHLAAQQGHAGQILGAGFVQPVRRWSRAVGINFRRERPLLS